MTRFRSLSTQILLAAYSQHQIPHSIITITIQNVDSKKIISFYKKKLNQKSFLLRNFYFRFISVEQKAEQAYFWKWRRVKYLRVLNIFLILVVIEMMPDLNRSDCGCEMNDNHFWISSINSPHRINVSSQLPHLSLFSLSLIHIFTTESAVRAYIFYEDGL